MAYVLRALEGDHTRTTELTLWWDAGGSTTNLYAADGDTATDLFQRWVADMRTTYPDGTVPIVWSIHDGHGAASIWAAPYQDAELEGGGTPYGDFLEHWEYPTDEQTGKRLSDFSTLPVAETAWTGDHTPPGGFIETVTGWHPEPYQSSVRLADLEQAANR